MSFCFWTLFKFAKLIVPYPKQNVSALLMSPEKENKRPIKASNSYMVRPAGIEPARLAPEASALSSELRALPEHYIIPDSDGQNIRYPASLSRLSG